MSELNKLTKIIFRKFMELDMCLIILKQLQIFRSIIILNTIDVVHYLFRFEITSENFFHYQAASTNITMIIAKRMIRLINENIAQTFNYAASPMRIFRTFATNFSFMFFRKFFAFSFKTYFIFSFRRMVLSKHWVIFSYLCSRHIIFSIKEAAFGGLSETVKLLHLRRPELSIKIPFPISRYNIAPFGLNVKGNL